MQAIVYTCDDCGKPIEDRRARIAMAFGTEPHDWPIDQSSGRPSLDLCFECRNGLLDYLAGRKAGRGVVDAK
jgi:hypothetical protein